MGQQEAEAVRQVLREAASAPQFFDLSDAELVRLAILGVLGDLFDRLVRQLQIIVEVHEPGHDVPPS